MQYEVPPEDLRSLWRKQDNLEARLGSLRRLQGSVEKWLSLHELELGKVQEDLRLFLAPKIGDRSEG